VLLTAKGGRGTTESRPALDEILHQLRAGDTIVIWRLDRLGRSLGHLIELVSDLEQGGVGLRSLTESTALNTRRKLLVHVSDVLAEFARDPIRQCTAAGLAAARARGRVGERPTVWNSEKRMPQP